VAVLAHLRDQDAWPATLLRRERVGQLADFAQTRRAFTHLSTIHARDRADRGLVTAPHALERAADLADAGAGARGVDREREQVALAGLRRRGQRVERRAQFGLVAALAQLLQALDLCRTHRAVLDLEDRDLL